MAFITSWRNRHSDADYYVILSAAKDLVKSCKASFGRLFYMYSCAKMEVDFLVSANF